uniref:Uncharacterized protein n=1 Tax=Strigamia maritima TaxID=126957 RepID=T1JJU9_STRMM
MSHVAHEGSSDAGSVVSEIWVRSSCPRGNYGAQNLGSICFTRWWRDWRIYDSAIILAFSSVMCFKLIICIKYDAEIQLLPFCEVEIQLWFFVV